MKKRFKVSENKIKSTILTRKKKGSSKKAKKNNDRLNDDTFDRIKIFEEVDEGFEENKNQSIFLGNF